MHNDEILSDSDRFPGFRVIENTVYKYVSSSDGKEYNWRRVIPDEKKNEVLRRYRDESAHLGFAKTLANRNFLEEVGKWSVWILRNRFVVARQAILKYFTYLL